MRSKIKPNTFFLIALFPLLFLISCKKDGANKNNNPALKIGDEYAGGLIFYINSTGQHGLVATKSGLELEGQWGCIGDSILGTKTDLGTGQANTKAIINGCSTQGIAAWLADDLVYNGYSDWFLPSKDELSLIFLHKDVLEFYTPDIRLSSSQFDHGRAWGIPFDQTSIPGLMNKSIVRKIRVVRAF